MFKLNTKVRIKNTTDPSIDGKTGLIKGVSSEHHDTRFLIVLLDNPKPYQWECISIIDSCLEII